MVMMMMMIKLTDCVFVVNYIHAHHILRGYRSNDDLYHQQVHVTV